MGLRFCVCVQGDALCVNPWLLELMLVGLALCGLELSHFGCVTVRPQIWQLQTAQARSNITTHLGPSVAAI